MINEILATGRKLSAIETQLSRLAPRDPRRPAMSRSATALQAKQTSQIAAALRKGVDESTISFALSLHGQGADRDPCRNSPTPAEKMLDLITRHGGERVIEALDAQHNMTT
jgi:hypothetical protein